MERRRVNGNGVVYVLANGKEQQPKIQYDDPELGHQVIHPGNVCFVSSGDGPHRAAQRIQFTLVEENEHRNDQQGGGKRSQGPDPIPFASRKKDHLTQCHNNRKGNRELFCPHRCKRGNEGNCITYISLVTW